LRFMRKAKASILIIILVFAGLFAVLSVPISPDLVVYVSADDVYSAPLVREFERLSGLKVALVTDGEATKSSGLFHRLLREKHSPVADVFWNNEISRTLLLARAGVLAPSRSVDCLQSGLLSKARERLWHPLALRARVIIYNTHLVKPQQAPDSIYDLIDSKWRGKVAVAYPLFGTTSTHFAALRARPDIGRKAANRFFEKLVAAGARIVNGNGIVARMVSNGSVAIGLTDTDDAWAVIDGGGPVAMVYPDQEAGGLGTLLIPNTVSIISGSRRQENAQRFVTFLLSAPAQRMLARPPARHLPLRDDVAPPVDAKGISQIEAMKVKWSTVADELELMTSDIERIFPR
jgi:iron(III) transport system substrate-binding protein